MKNTQIKLTPVSIETMLNDKENSSYNVSVWNEKVNSYSKYAKCQFYLVPKDECFTYDRFYVSYVADGIYFFSKWSAFSSCISSNTFKKAFVIDGQLFSMGFGLDRTKGIVNTKEGRAWIRKELTSLNIMVSNCI